jgi:hypothetical protein
VGKVEQGPGRIFVPGFDGMANVRVERDWENWPELLAQIKANAAIDWGKQRIITHISFLAPSGELKLSSGAVLAGYPDSHGELKFEFAGQMKDVGSGMYTDRCDLTLKRTGIDASKGLDGFTYVFKAGPGDLVYVSGQGRVEVSSAGTVTKTDTFGVQ